MSRYYSSVKHRKWQRRYHLSPPSEDPVVAAAIAHLNSPVVFNFVSKASLADCVIHGTTTPSMAAGSFASGASGFPFDNDAGIVSGVTITASAGEFIACYMTDIDATINSGAALFRTNALTRVSMYLNGADERIVRYGGGLFSGSGYTGVVSHILSNGDVYLDGSNEGTATFSSIASDSLHIGGTATASTQIKGNCVYFVYAPSIATSAAAAASAIHSAMVAGAP